MSSRKRVWQRILRVLGIALVVVLIAVGVGLYRFVNYDVPAAYANWGTGELLVDHVKQNDELPQSWNDLKAAWDDGVAMHAIGIVSFEELCEWIEIDFDRLNELSKPYPQRQSIPLVVRGRNGSTVSWGDADANWILNEYLQKSPLGETRSVEGVP